MILTDTSVWIDHLRHGNRRLERLLLDAEVVCHPFIIGELACGSIRNRGEVIARLESLPQSRVAEQSEVMHLLESERLFGRGLGWIDAHLLASSLLTRCDLWTLDRSLDRAARLFGISA